MGERVWVWVIAAGSVVCGCAGAAVSEKEPSTAAEQQPPIAAAAPAPAHFPGVVRIAGDDGSATPQPDPNADAPRVAIYDHGSGRSTASFPDAAPPTATGSSPMPASGAPASSQQAATAAAPGAAKPQSGGVSNAAHVVAAMRAGFRGCYQAGLVEDSHLAGTVRVVIHVGADGSVTDAQGTPQGQISPSLVECVLSRAREAKFDRPEGGSAVIAVPVTFVKN